MINQQNKHYFLLSAIIIIVTIFIYFPSLNNQFVDYWDDGTYIINNPQIKSLHGDSVSYTVKNLFKSFHNGHYHPLTNLSYAIEYSYFGLNPKPYHIINLLIHVLNALLVFAFIFFLNGRMAVAFITALLFAIHPMHVETVAWISDRKDLLCCTFFLAASISYIKYLDDKKVSWYIITFLLFALALLSKALAVTLPIVFLIIDRYKGIKLSLKSIAPKLIFFILALVFGYLSILAQKSGNALGDFTSRGPIEKIIFSSYSLVMYIVKLFSFGNLSAFYNFPISRDGSYPLVFYIMPFIVAAIIYFLIKLNTRKQEFVFGFLFFLITIVMVLQIIPAGGVIMADRYTYIPYIGLCFIIAIVINELLSNEKLKQKIPRQIVYGALIVYFAFCGYYSFARTKVWNNNMVLWCDTIEKNPDAAVPYCNRGSLYILTKEYDKAINDFTKAIDLAPKYTEAYFNRGLSFFNTKKYREAIMDFDFVMKNKPVNLLDVYLTRGQSYMYLKDYKKAYEDLSDAIRCNVNCEPAYYYRGKVLQSAGHYKEAIDDYSMVIRFNPSFAMVRLYRAVLFYKTGNFKYALEDAIAAKNMGYPVDPRMIIDFEAKVNGVTP